MPYESLNIIQCNMFYIGPPFIVYHFLNGSNQVCGAYLGKEVYYLSFYDPIQNQSIVSESIIKKTNIPVTPPLVMTELEERTLTDLKFLGISALRDIIVKSLKGRV